MQRYVVRWFFVCPKERERERRGGRERGRERERDKEKDTDKDKEKDKTKEREKVWEILFLNRPGQNEKSARYFKER
jgi:hypothetical protein